MAIDCWLDGCKTYTYFYYARSDEEDNESLSEWSDDSFHTSEESDYMIQDSEDSQDSFTSESFMTHSEDDEFGEHVIVHSHHGVSVATKHRCIQMNLNDSEPETDTWIICCPFFVLCFVFCFDS